MHSRGGRAAVGAPGRARRARAAAVARPAGRSDDRRAARRERLRPAPAPLRRATRPRPRHDARARRWDGRKRGRQGGEERRRLRPRTARLRLDAITLDMGGTSADVGVVVGRGDPVGGPVRARMGPADRRARRRPDHDRRRWQLRRGLRPAVGCSRSARRAPAPTRGRPRTGRAARRRRSRTRTSCSAVSTRPISSAAQCRSTRSSLAGGREPIADQLGCEVERPRTRSSASRARTWPTRSGCCAPTAASTTAAST